MEDVAAGIAVVGTPSHGGVWLSPDRNAKVPAALRDDSGWYEEDCQAYIAMWVFWDEFAALYPTWSREQCADRIRQWFPDEWMAATGETVSGDQSQVLADREFLAEHTQDWIVRAAWGSWHDAVPAGKVGVVASLGGTGEQLRWFLVPAQDYEARGRMFVVDVDSSVEVDAFA